MISGGQIKACEQYMGKRCRVLQEQGWIEGVVKGSFYHSPKEWGIKVFVDCPGQSTQVIDVQNTYIPQVCQFEED